MLLQVIMYHHLFRRLRTDRNIRLILWTCSSAEGIFIRNENLDYYTLTYRYQLLLANQRDIVSSNLHKLISCNFYISPTHSLTLTSIVLICRHNILKNQLNVKHFLDSRNSLDTFR